MEEEVHLDPNTLLYYVHKKKQERYPLTPKLGSRLTPDQQSDLQIHMAVAEELREQHIWIAIKELKTTTSKIIQLREMLKLWPVDPFEEETVDRYDVIPKDLYEHIHVTPNLEKEPDPEWEPDSEEKNQDCLNKFSRRLAGIIEKMVENLRQHLRELRNDVLDQGLDPETPIEQGPAYKHYWNLKRELEHRRKKLVFDD